MIQLFDWLVESGARVEYQEPGDGKTVLMRYLMTANADVQVLRHIMKKLDCY
jgi:hypothetical protein